MAGAAGALKDPADEQGGTPVEVSIIAHPHFERLEADGVVRHGGWTKPDF